MGGAEGFSRLAGTMREHGMHLISGVVPHGGKSVQARELPEWQTRDRKGKLSRKWSGLAMDNASPEWQDVLKRSMRMLADAGNIEGVRIDVAPGQGANWGSPRTNHASYSSMGGCLELMAALGDGIRTEQCPVPIMLPEGADEPEYFAVPGTTTIGYGWNFWMFSYKLFKGQLLSQPELMNEKFRTFFENERGSLPPGALGLRCLGNHDIVCSQGRASIRFGTGLHQALYGMLLSVPGLPMLYQEEEMGSFFALRRMNLARQALPQLAAGPVVYLPVDFAHPAVFSTIRRDPKQPVLCLVNLSGNPIEIDVELPVDFPASSKLWDAISGISVDIAGKRLRWTLKSYETAFLTSKPVTLTQPELPIVAKPAPKKASLATVARRQGEMLVEFDLPKDQWHSEDPADAASRTFVGKAGKITIERQDKGVAVVADLIATRKDPGLTLTVRGAQRWTVSGRTALLDDLALRRHYPFPESSGYVWQRLHAGGGGITSSLYNRISAVGRLWQSLVEPLHPDRPAIAFTDRDGKSIAVCDLQTDAMNVVLTNADDEDPNPERLELRILGIDTDLADPVQLMGQTLHWPNWRLPWRLNGHPVDSRPLHVAFLLRFPESQTMVKKLLHAPRLPIQQYGEDLLVEAPQAKGWNRKFLPQPSSFTWSNLSPVTGLFEIELELSLSEISATGTDLANAYEITLDGKKLPIRWVRKNVWSDSNAFFAKANVGPVDLGGKRHSLQIRTLRAGCALLPELHLIPATGNKLKPVAWRAPQAKGGARKFLPKPDSFTLSNLPPVKGRFEIELELRLSEVSGTSMDLADGYEITLDGKKLPIRWGKRNVWSSGNAFFAKANVGPVDLGGKQHSLRIRTFRPWCGLLPELYIIKAADQ
jgi:hypothetical protein